ncbi:MAG: hypothetical protein AAGA56_22115, partial [Myxococcota bacterium]
MKRWWWMLTLVVAAGGWGCKLNLKPSHRMKNLGKGKRVSAEPSARASGDPADPEASPSEPSPAEPVPQPSPATIARAKSAGLPAVDESAAIAGPFDGPGG